MVDSTDAVRAGFRSPEGKLLSGPRNEAAGIERLRASVRPIVTLILVVWGLSLATVVIVWLLRAAMHSEAIAVLGGVMGLVGIVVGFYYRARDDQRDTPPGA